MTKAAKPKRKKRTPATCMVVIRASVPRRYADRMKVAAVYGTIPNGGHMHKLEILSAYYDLPKQPNARR